MTTLKTTTKTTAFPTTENNVLDHKIHIVAIINVIFAIANAVLEIRNVVCNIYSKSVHLRGVALSILMSNENAPLFRCAYLWPIESCVKLCYL